MASTLPGSGRWVRSLSSGCKAHRTAGVVGLWGPFRVLSAILVSQVKSYYRAFSQPPWHGLLSRVLVWEVWVLAAAGTQGHSLGGGLWGKRRCHLS